MKKTFKGAMAFAFCIVTIFATMLIASAIGAPKAKVKSVTYNTVTISWSAVKGADGGYQVQRSTDGKKWTTLTSSTKETSYKDTKLTTGRTYRYRVRAIDRGLLGRKTYSSWSSVVKGKPVPAKVTSLKSTPSHNSVKLTWKKVSGATGYVVQRYTKGEWKTYKTTTKTGLTVSKLTLGKTYNFRVRAYRTVSKKKIYGAYSSTLKTGPALKAPSSFVLKGVTTSTVKLAWSAVEGAKGYEVYNKATKKWTNTKTKRTLTVKSLKAGTKYQFIVRAYSGKYDGIKSATRTYITTPAAPKSLKNTKATTNALTFSWGAVTGAAGYQLQYTADGKTWKSLANTTATSATVTGLANGTKYTVRVRAYVKNSNVKDISATSYGSWSSTASAYTSVLAPKSVYLTKVSTSSLTVGWSASTGATGYEVYNSKTGAWTSTGTSRSYTLSGLSAGTKYTFKVRALRSTSKSPETSSYSFITSPAAPTNLKSSTITVNGVTFADATANSITVSWSAVKGAAKYQVQYSADGSAWTSAPETTATTATVKSLKAGTAYSIRVRAYLKNSNVSGISATAYGAYATTSARTLSDAKTTVSTASDSHKTISVSWQAVNGASAYVIEKFVYSEKDWVPFDFTSKLWSAYDDLGEDSVIATTETSFIDDTKANAKAEIYRVRIVDANGYIGVPSDVIGGDTADIEVNVGKYYTEIEFTGTEGASTISLIPLYPYSSSEPCTYTSKDFTYSNGMYKIKAALAPDAIHSLIIIARDSSNKTVGIANTITVKTEPLSINASDPASVNSQLLYLTHAINNTKSYTDKITVKLASTIATACGDLEIYQNGKRSVLLELFLGGLIDGELTEEIKETQNYSFTFTDGKAKDENNVNVTLRNFIEPNSNSSKYAYLYNGNNPTEWSKGIKDVKTVKNSDGSHSISFTLKQEKNSTLYHDGFLSVLNAASLSQEDLKTEEVITGESKISATITSDYLLKTYTASAPFSGKFSLSMTATEDSSEGDVSISAGDTIAFKIPISGKAEFTYTISK